MRTVNIDYTCAMPNKTVGGLDEIKDTDSQAYFLNYLQVK